MTRKQQLWILVLCSAITAALQYVLQGSMATGGDPATFSPAFWVADRALWGVRALIESWVVIYLFTTTTTSSSAWIRAFQEIVLLVLEVALLALIAFTLGPVFQALGAKTTVYALMGAGGYTNWAFAIGLYTSLMMAGAGIGYKIQPWDLKEGVRKVEPTVEQYLSSQIPKLTRAQGVPLLTDIIREKGVVNQSAFARQANVHPQTVGRWLKHMEEHQIIVPSGNGNFVIVEEEMEMPEFN